MSFWLSVCTLRSRKGLGWEPHKFRGRYTHPQKNIYIILGRTNQLNYSCATSKKTRQTYLFGNWSYFVRFLFVFPSHSNLSLIITWALLYDDVTKSADLIYNRSRDAISCFYFGGNLVLFSYELQPLLIKIHFKLKQKE